MLVYYLSIKDLAIVQFFFQACEFDWDASASQVIKGFKI